MAKKQVWGLRVLYLMPKDPTQLFRDYGRAAWTWLPPISWVEAQNLKITEVGKGLQDYLVQLSAYPHHPHYVPHWHIYTFLKHLQGCSSLFQCLITLSEKKFFLIPSWTFPWCNLKPLLPIWSLFTWEKRLTSISPEPPFR